MIFEAKKGVYDRYPGRRYLPNTSEYDSGGEHFLCFQHSTVLVQCLGIVGLVQFFSDFAKCLIYFPEL